MPIGAVKILNQGALRLPDKDSEDVRLVKGRRHGRMVAGRKGECVPLPGSICGCIAMGCIPELRAETNWGIKAPVIEFLVRSFSWLIGIVLVGWIA